MHPVFRLPPVVGSAEEAKSPTMQAAVIPVAHHVRFLNHARPALHLHGHSYITQDREPHSSAMLAPCVILHTTLRHHH